MPTLTSNEVTTRLSKRLANFKLGDAVISSLADRVVIEGLSMGRINPCIYGICVDYFTEKLPQIAVDPKTQLKKWEVFPYGILEWDLFHVRAAYGVPELEGKGLVRGFEG